MADNLVASFVALRDKDERLQALRSIVNGLSLAERNAVNAAISQRNDIISRLPFELALLVFTFLDPLDTWTLRPVSKQWNALLSTSEFQQGAVLNWSTHDESDRVQPVQIRTLQYEIRHMQAFQTGRPFSWKRFQGHGQLQLQGRYLVHRNHDSLFVRDLCSGTVNEFKDEARERPSEFILTSTIVAYTTVAAGFLYWKRLDDLQGPMRKIQLPSANIHATGGDKDLIVLLTRRHQGASDYRGVQNIIVFDASTSQLRSAYLPITHHEDGPAQYWKWQMIVNAEKQVADLFCVPARRQHHQDTLIYHLHAALDGSMVEENKMRTRHSLYHGELSFRAPRNAGHKDLYLLGLHGDIEVVCSLLFDANEGVRADEESLGPRPDPKSEFVLWKDSVFRPTKPESREEWVDRGSFGDYVCVGTLCGRYKRFGKESFVAAAPFHDRLDCRRLVVNDSFLVAVEGGIENKAAVVVFCFEEDVQMHGGRSTGLWDEEKDDAGKEHCLYLRD